MSDAKDLTKYPYPNDEYVPFAFNVKKIDEFVNSTNEYTDNRKDRNALTWFGIEEANRRAREALNYTEVDYQDGNVIDTLLQYVIAPDGNAYVISPSVELPYTLTGDWSTDSPNFWLGQDVMLRSQLASPSGAGMVRNGGKTVGEIIDHAQIVVKSISELRGFTPEILTNQTPVCTVLCHTVDGDGGGGTFVWDPSSASQDDNGTIINGWRRVIEGPVYAEWFGARSFIPSVDDPSLFDSADAFQAASDYAGIGGAWMFRGVHRITKTINIPRRQTFGSYGTSRSWNPGNLSNWQGVNTPQSQKLDNAVFFDPPSKSGYAFQCEEDARPHDFLAYSLGFNEPGLDVTHSQPESKHYAVDCFRFNKYITLNNVSIWLFRSAFLSEGFDGNEGNFYSTYSDFEVGRCFEAFTFKTSQPYNQRLFNPKITATSRFMNLSHGMSNMTIHGGSIEGWRYNSPIRGSGNIAIFGTYFETFNTDASGSIFYLNADGNFFNFTYIGGLCYLNNTSGLLFTEKVNTTINSSGNTFAYGGGSKPSTDYVYRASGSATPTFGGSGVGDTYSGLSGAFAYTNKVFGLQKEPKGMANSGDVISTSTQGIKLEPMSSAPANPSAGIMYLANGSSWNPLSRTGGYAYFVCWRGSWQDI